ncbi:MAG: hypothetical protein R2695_15555 [Acidimicrobiales bacterium]
MDFNLNETEQAISDLAHRILADRVDHERLKAIEAAVDSGGEWFAAAEWQLLADAGLTGIALPRPTGAAGSASSRPGWCARRWVATSRRCPCCPPRSPP